MERIDPPLDASAMIEMLDPAFRQEGMARVESPPAEAAYALVPSDDVLIAALFGQDGPGRSIVVTLVVDPLVTPSSIRLAFPLKLAKRLPGWTRRGATTDQLAQLAPGLAALVKQRLTELRDRYGDHGRFAAAVDDEYLSVELPELAEAVAYSWILADELEVARRVLEALRHNPGADSEVTERSKLVTSLLASDPEAAKRQIREWRESRLRTYGEAAQAAIPAWNGEL